MSNVRGSRQFILLFILMVFPVAVYFLLRTGKNVYHKLPYYGEREVAANGEDTIYHSISDFKLVNQAGDTVSHQALDEHVYVADFFFVKCPTICPTMSSQMQRVYALFKDNPTVRFASFTVNPEADSVPVLAAYAKAHEAATEKWLFLTGDKKEIYRLARHDYLVNAMQGDGGPDDFIHSEMFVLVDKDKHIRGYYDGTSTKSVDTLMDEVRVLLSEKSEKSKIPF